MQQVNVSELYAGLKQKHDHARKVLGQPLTLAEKIIWSHLHDSNQKKVTRGKDFILLRPDRVAMQDATAQMAILQFIQAGKPQTMVPTTIHCDHLILAYEGSGPDVKQALENNREVFDFLSSAGRKYGMGFWQPGSGIIHQVVLENYAFPGGMMIGTDSHTPNAGGLGMMAVGVGGADAVDVMVGMPWEVLYPKVTGVKLTGKMSGWTSGKDIILKLLEILTVKGGTNKIIEYFGSGVETLSCTAQATVTNMGAELGATCSIFPYHKAMGKYLEATRREDIAELAEKYAASLRPDPEVEKDPAKYYDEVIEINLDELEPYIVGPHSPDKARPISKLAGEVDKENYPDNISAALIGSCTNSSYEDVGRSASVAKQVLDQGEKTQTQFLVTPGSDQVLRTTERDGFLDTLSKAGATVLANACGPCIGQWKRKDQPDGSRNSIVTSFNRNFRGRNDGNAETLSFIGSPEVVTAMAFAGSLKFNPLTDELKFNGKSFKLNPPSSDELPAKGFQFDDSGFIAPAKDANQVDLKVDPNSDRLQILEPFKPWDGKDFSDLLVLVKAKGKCTTDHISPAGKWLRFRGHLDNISNNMFSGAVNAFTEESGKGNNQLNGSQSLAFSDIAREYQTAGKNWVVFGDENYGEGSSREHAAMSPRYLGCRAVITKSMARIHETNLKKQGILPLHLLDTSDYDKVQEQDRVEISGLREMTPGKNLTVTLRHQDGSSDSFEVRHTFNAEQIEWFKAGSALNRMR